MSTFRDQLGESKKRSNLLKANSAGMQRKANAQRTTSGNMCFCDWGHNAAQAPRLVPGALSANPSVTEIHANGGKRCLCLLLVWQKNPVGIRRIPFNYLMEGSVKWNTKGGNRWEE